MNFTAAINTFFIWQKMDLKFLEPINNLNTMSQLGSYILGAKLENLILHISQHTRLLLQVNMKTKIYICACKFTTDIKTNT